MTVIDKNDVAPSWASGPWKFEISEDAPPNTIVTVLKAHDPDTIGTLKYAIVENANGADLDEENSIEGSR